MKKIITVALVGMLMLAGVSAKPHKYYNPCDSKIEWTAKEYKDEVKLIKDALDKARADLKKFDTMISNWSNIDDSDGVNNWKGDVNNCITYVVSVVNYVYRLIPQEQLTSDSLCIKLYNNASECINHSYSLLQFNSITAGDHKLRLVMTYNVIMTYLQILERYYGALVAQR
jgi:hypothetical protein